MTSVERAEARRRLVDRGVVAGAGVGLTVNVLVFLAVYGLPWGTAEQRFAPLLLGLLYGAATVTAGSGLWLLRRGPSRRFGAGLVVATAVVVVAWFALAALDTYLTVSGNTAGG